MEQKWDYIYIDDLILTLILVAEYGKENKVYVTGSGVARPMYEYVQIIKNKIDSKAELGIGDIPYKTDKIDHAVTDITELKEDVFCHKNQCKYQIIDINIIPLLFQSRKGGFLSG